MIFEIYEHFKAEYPREGCGVIGVVKGRKKWFPCKNLAENNQSFIMDSKDYFEAKKRSDIIAIVHNHLQGSNEPSQIDINNCNAMQIPYHIYSYPEMELNILEPTKNKSKLIGRKYEFGVSDCFEAMRDYLAEQQIYLPPRILFEENWYNKGLNYFEDEVISQWGGVKMNTPPQKNDVLIFTVQESVPNHCGVYLGKDLFYHHAINRLSCREHLYPFWIKYLTGVYRYDENSLF